MQVIYISDDFTCRCLSNRVMWHCLRWKWRGNNKFPFSGSNLFKIIRGRLYKNLQTSSNFTFYDFLVWYQKKKTLKEESQVNESHFVPFGCKIWTGPCWIHQDSRNCIISFMNYKHERYFAFVYMHLYKKSESWVVIRLHVG